MFVLWSYASSSIRLRYVYPRRTKCSAAGIWTRVFSENVPLVAIGPDAVVAELLNAMMYCSRFLLALLTGKVNNFYRYYAVSYRLFALQYKLDIISA